MFDCSRSEISKIDERIKFILNRPVMSAFSAALSALDAVRLLSCPALENLEKYSSRCFVKRIRQQICGEDVEMETLDQQTLTRVRTWCWRFLECLVDTDLLPAHALIAIKHNLITIDRKHIEPVMDRCKISGRQIRNDLAERFDKKFISLKNNESPIPIDPKLIAHFNAEDITINGDPDGRNYHPYLLFLAIAYEFAEFKKTCDYNCSEIAFMQTIVEQFCGFGQTEISLANFIDNICDGVPVMKMEDEGVKDAGYCFNGLTDAYILDHLAAPLYTAIYTNHESEPSDSLPDSKAIAMAAKNFLEDQGIDTNVKLPLPDIAIELLSYFLLLRYESRNSGLRIFDLNDFGDASDIFKNKGFEDVLEMAEAGDCRAQFVIGKHYEKGIGALKDPHMAFQWYLKSAEGGYPIAQFNVGECYMDGSGISKNSQKAFEWYLKAAENGHQDSQIITGLCYLCGKGVQEDAQQGYHWLLNVYDRNSVKVQCQIGRWFWQGIWGKKYPQKGFEWFLKAANQGMDEAQILTGIGFLLGKGVKQDSQTALQWFLKAAEQNNDWAITLVAGCYLVGHGTAPNRKYAIEWLLKKDDMDYGSALFEIGGWYEPRGVTSHVGIAYDDEQSFEWYLKAAKQGYEFAYEKVAECYLFGKGVARDEDNAFKWVLKSAKDEKEAQYQIGVSYQNRKRLHPDFAGLAFKWFLKAAEAGNASAQKTVAQYYLHGEEVEHDETKALEWYAKSGPPDDIWWNLSNMSNSQTERSTRQINGDIRCEIAYFYHNEIGGLKGRRAAYVWFKRAIQFGSAAALEAIIKCLIFGLGVKRNESDALKCLLNWFDEDYPENNEIRWFQWLDCKPGKCSLPEAQYRIGQCYEEDMLSSAFQHHDAQDWERAFDWYLKAARHGLGSAQEIVGDRYINGVVVKRDKSKAFGWYLKAAEQGQKSAQQKVGECYLAGSGVEHNLQQALDWLCRSNLRNEGPEYNDDSEPENSIALAEAQYQIAKFYQKENNAQSDNENACHWYLAAAELGHQYAQYEVGNCYNLGKGVSKDKQKAFEWYLKAADQGHQDAQHKISDFYLHGTGVKKNENEAKKWLEKATRSSYWDLELLDEVLDET